MIITKRVKIKTMGISIKHYKNLGYPAEHKKIITIDIKDLTIGSDIIIEAVCDYCSDVKNISYNRYNISLKTLGTFSCLGCRKYKIEKICLDKYGVKNVSQLKSVKIKKENTCMKNYSVKNPSHSKEVLNKIGDSLESNLGVRHALQDKNTLKKAQSTTEGKYGVKHALNNSKLLEKSKQTCLKNNGVEFCMQSDVFKNKAKNTRIKNGIQIPDELINKWELYKRKVRNETNKYKKTLFKEWDGCDFYDNECIKDNLNNFKPRSPNYPSIDHKISVSYGFLNNISEKIIGNIENLCITKTKINCSKKELNYNEFVL